MTLQNGVLASGCLAYVFISALLKRTRAIVVVPIGVEVFDQRLCAAGLSNRGFPLLWLLLQNRLM